MSFFWCCCLPAAGGGQCDLCEAFDLPELFVTITGVTNEGVCGCDDINDTWTIPQIDNCEWYGSFPGDFCGADTLEIFVEFQDLGGGDVRVFITVQLTGDTGFGGRVSDAANFSQDFVAFTCALTSEQIPFLERIGCVFPLLVCWCVLSDGGPYNTEVFLSTP